MLSTSLAAVVIALAVLVAAQIFHEAGIVTADARNLCLAAFAVWCAIASAVFVFGVFVLFRKAFPW